MSGVWIELGIVNMLCFNLFVSCVVISEFECGVVLMMSVLIVSVVISWLCCGKCVVWVGVLSGYFDMIVLCVVILWVSVWCCVG